MNINPIKIAIVYDKLVTWGGAERLLLLLNNLYPDAEIFTTIYNKKTAPWTINFSKIHYSSILSWIFRRNYRLATPVLSWRMEQFDFSKFDLVISLTSYSAKSIITTANTCHICLCLTPDRYLWFEDKLDYQLNSIRGKIIHKIDQFLKPIRQIEDQFNASKPDFYLTISKKVANRISKYYRRNSDIVYPGVNVNKFINSEKKRDDFYLIVGRMTNYKQMDQVVTVFNKLGKKLIIVGDGPKMNYLKSISSSNISFKGVVTDTDLIELYQSTKALIAIQDEDFGLVVLESLACGTPVIVNTNSGVSEILDGKCAVFVNMKENDLVQAIDKFESTTFSTSNCRNVAQKYSDDFFMRNISNLILRRYNDYFAKLNNFRAL